jgi:Zn-dependent protease with chaperone function
LLWVLRKTVVFAKGGLGLRLTAPFWGSHWREREYTADRYAAGLGQAEDLADFLEIHALMHDHPVPFIWLTEHTHPPTELRIDKLHKTTLNDQPTQGTPTPATSDTHPLTA